MKFTSLAIAAAIALVPAVASADEAKKEELKTAKKAIDKDAMKKAAQAAADKKTQALIDAANKKNAAAASASNADKEAAVKAEKELHAKNVGAIERLEQIATATNNTDLKAVAARLNEKETKRHTLAQ